MSKVLKWLLASVAIVVLAACGGGGSSGDDSGDSSGGSDFGGSSGSSAAHHGTDSLPNIYGYNYIEILNNVNGSNEAVINVKNRYGYTDGYRAATVSRDVHCTDYQYSEGDKYQDIYTDGVRMKMYLIGEMICTETDYRNGPATVSGSDTVVVGIE